MVKQRLKLATMMLDTYPQKNLRQVQAHPLHLIPLLPALLRQQTL
jgi:hypothetical protein